MINDDVFMTIFIMILASFTFLLLIISMIIISAVEIFRFHKIKWLPVKVGIGLLGCLVLYLSIPWWLFICAYNPKWSDRAEYLHKLAINSTTIPSVKANLYKYLGIYYERNLRGADAIAAYENSYKVKESKSILSHLCNIYTIKGDNSAAIAACIACEDQKMLVINNILTKEYLIALENINIEINSSKKADCSAYALRGYIYRAIGDDEKAEIDLSKALELCPNDLRLKGVRHYENFYEGYYNAKKKEFGF